MIGFRFGCFCLGLFLYLLLVRGLSGGWLVSDSYIRVVIGYLVVRWGRLVWVYLWSNGGI